MAETGELFTGGLEAYRRQDREEAGAAADDGRESAAVKGCRPIDRNQMLMRPVNIDELVEADHPVRAIWAMVCQLDWSGFEEDIKVVEGGKGRSCVDRRLLAALWLYGYSEGVSSARELARLCNYEPGCQWLTGMQEVNYHTLADFRGNNREAQDDLFKQVLGRLSAEGLTDLKRVGHDGTKIRAQASANSFRREDRLREHLKLAEEQIQAMGDPDAEEFSQRVMQARQRAAREKKQRLEQALEELKRFEQDRQKRRISETEAEARIMKQADGGFAPNYNVQITTDALNKIVVAVAITQAGDANQLVPALDAVASNSGRQPEQVLTDGAYTHNANIEEAARRGIDLIGPLATSHGEASLKKRGVSREFYPDKFSYDAANNTVSCPTGKSLQFQTTSQHEGRRKHHYRAQAADCQHCPFRQQCCPKKAPRGITRTEDSEVVRAFKDKMQTEAAKQIYRQRSELAETPNAWIKDKFGLRRFRLRGLVKAGMEAVWACLSYNIRQWIRLRWKPQLAATLAGAGPGVSV